MKAFVCLIMLWVESLCALWLQKIIDKAENLIVESALASGTKVNSSEPTFSLFGRKTDWHSRLSAFEGSVAKDVASRWYRVLAVPVGGIAVA